MTYERLVGIICENSGYPEEAIKDILGQLPEALVCLEEGGSVRTPLGVFRMVRKKGRKVKLPNSDKVAQVVESLEVRLRPGTRLKVDVRDY